MTDATRSSFEAIPKIAACIERWGIVFIEGKYVQELTPDAKSRLCDQITQHYEFYQQGYLAAKSEPIVLPTPKDFENEEQADEVLEEVIFHIISQGYQVKES